jgi:hypothetical protein
MSFKDFVANTVVPLGNTLIIFLYGVAFFLFLYGILQYFFLGGEKGIEKGKKFVVSGVIGFVVIFCVWGIIRVLLNTLALPTS